MKVPIRQSAPSALALVILLVATGCSSFNREWKTATAVPGATNRFDGRWEGTWLSDVNGHNGALRCVLKRVSDTHYQAHFKATYWKIFRGSYEVDLTGGWEKGVWTFQGNEDLGWLFGGVYRYQGRISPTNFFSTYESKHDHGKFELRRPK
jgi:hypothetical protein